MADSQRMWMTQEAHDRLEAELIELTEPRVGSEADDLGERQARQARARQIHELLSNAVVGQDPPNDGVAEPGMVLTIRYDDSGETEVFLLGVRDDDQSDMEVYSPHSPLGKAVTGARPGEQRSYQVPSGATASVTLVDAVPYGLHHNRDSA